MAWLARILVDASLMFLFAMRTMNRPLAGAGKPRAFAPPLLAAALLSAALVDSLWLRAAALLAGVAFSTVSLIPLFRAQLRTAGGFR